MSGFPGRAPGPAPSCSISIPTTSGEKDIKEVTVLRRVIIGLVLVASLGVVVVGTVAARNGSLSPDLQKVRAAVAKYHDYANAVADGYSLAGEPCVSSPDGAMGVHAANQGLIRAGVLDPLRPNVLLYMPRKDGSLDLIGVEYMRVDADQNLETDGDRPSLFGHAFQGPMLGHNPTMPIHYDLHVWVVDNNPSGTFAQFNPDFHC
jgi:hypothetical protein